MSVVIKPPGRGILVIVSSPSGAGKTTLTRRLIAEFGWLEFSISYATRAIRAGEQDGRDYHFVDAATFAAMADRGEFAEHAIVHGNRYGTARAPIDAALAAGRDVIFDVDWQGGRALSRQWPDDCLKVFILPPDLETLERRLRARATDAPEVIERRLEGAFDELNRWHEYQFQIVNDDLDRAYEVLRSLYLLRRCGTPYRNDRPELPYPLADLAATAMVAIMADPASHARRLVADRESHVSHPVMHKPG